MNIKATFSINDEKLNTDFGETTVIKVGGDNPNNSEIPEIDWEEINIRTTAGIYKLKDGDSYEILIVSGHDMFVMQTLLSGERISVRVLTTNEWSEWDTIISESYLMNVIQDFLQILGGKEDVSNKINDLHSYDKTEAKGEYPTALAIMNYIDTQLIGLWGSIGEQVYFKEEVDGKIDKSNIEVMELAKTVFLTLTDANEWYASREEVGDINSALDAIIALQSQY